MLVLLGCLVLFSMHWLLARCVLNLICAVGCLAQYITIPKSAQPSGYCNPSICWQDGSCYCTDLKNGWDSGGGLRVGGCASSGNYWCECDCYNTGTACQNDRCDDNIGIEKDGVCYDNAFGPLVHMDTARQKSCFKTQVDCKDVSTKCGLGQFLKGCMRYSEGTCVPCTVSLPDKHYWVGNGVCDYAACDAGQPGYFFQTPCTSTSNGVSLPCSQHFGNTQAAIDRAPTLADAQYYCPGGGKVVPVPSNGMVSADYTTFVCKPGFSSVGTSCYPCSPGYACPYGVAFQCPANYYSSTEQQIKCSRCRMDCSSSSDVPMRCGVGSIQDAACVTCNACGVWPDSGLNCILSREVQALAQSEYCTPCADQPGVTTVCEENGCRAS